jgi:hypothetical protein
VPENREPGGYIASGPGIDADRISVHPEAFIPGSQAWKERNLNEPGTEFQPAQTLHVMRKMLNHAKYLGAWM